MSADEPPPQDRVRTELLPDTSAALSKERDRERVGTVLGSYRVVALLGSGGMGCVFHAQHTKLDRDVALKLLRDHYASHREAVARFFHEARTVNRVRHRNIVDVTDFVELPDGTTFIVMEFLRGQSLGAWMRGGFELPRALAVLVQICDGLGAAHDVGVVHRDLKPDNIFVVPTGDGADLVKLLDFGIAKLLRDDEDVGFETAAGAVIGTPAYMSPEQANGSPVDPRSDIYSLGTIMYEIVCGRPVFDARSFGEYAYKHNAEAPIPPRERGAPIDARFEAVILRCLAKEPDERFASVGELRGALLAILGAHPALPPVTSAIDEAPAPRPRARTWLAGGAVLLAIGAGAAAWIGSRTAALPAIVDPAPVAPIAPAAAPTITPLPAQAPATPPPPPSPPSVAPEATPVAPDETPPPPTSGKRTSDRTPPRVQKRPPRARAATVDAADVTPSVAPDKSATPPDKSPDKTRVDRTDILNPYGDKP